MLHQVVAKAGVRSCKRGMPEPCQQHGESRVDQALVKQKPLLYLGASRLSAQGAKIAAALA
jgi:hypothetical protein